MIPSSIHSLRRRRRVVAEHDSSAILVSTAEDKHLHEFVEDYPIRYARTVTAQRMIYFSRWQPSKELFPDRVNDGCWTTGMDLLLDWKG
jgi:hypothetical protein